MKKLISVLLICSIFLISFSGCASHATINGQDAAPYGLVNEKSRKNPNVEYELSAGSVIVGILLFETIIVPVYIIGWDLYQPVGPKQPSK